MDTNVVTKADVIRALTQAGVKKDAVIMVHASMKPIGNLENGADTLIEALIEVVGPQGTIVMPTFTWYRMPETLHEPIVQENSPIWTGKVPQRFLEYPGVKRDRHPHWSHGYLGPLSDKFIELNEADLYGYGESKVHNHIYLNGGSTLMIACDFSSCSCMYVVHDKMELPYRQPLKKRRGTSVDKYMTLTPEQQFKLFDFENEYYNLPTSNFAPIEAPLRAAGVLKEASIGQSKMMHVSLADLFRVMEEQHQINPGLLFVEKKVDEKLKKLAAEIKGKK